MARPASSDTRIHAIDAIRGFCLLNIFINHVTVGVLSDFSPSRIFFADSADAFVLLAGISCFLAYGPHKQAGAAMLRKPWRRARTLLVANIGLVLVSMLLLLGFAAVAPPANPSLYPAALIDQHGLASYLWHILTLQQNVGYSVVLRLYVALLILAPAYIWLASVRYWLPLIPASALWLVAGHFDLAEHNSLTGSALSMTILPWNLIFAAGIALAAAMREDRPLPGGRIGVGLASALVLAGPICFTLATRMSPDVLAWVDSRNDMFWTGASKSLQSPLRVASLLAFAYLIIALRQAPIVRMIHAVSPQNILTQLGRRSLEVFVAGALLALIVDHLLWTGSALGLLQLRSFGAVAAELGMCGAALALLVWIARKPDFTFTRAEQTVARRWQRKPVTAGVMLERT